MVELLDHLLTLLFRAGVGHPGPQEARRGLCPQAMSLPCLLGVKDSSGASLTELI